MPNHYTPEEASAFAKFFSSGKTVTKLPPCCLVLKGAVPREEYESAKYLQDGFNSRRDGGTGETDAEGQNAARKHTRDLLQSRAAKWNAARSKKAMDAYPSIIALHNDGVGRNEIMRRLHVGKDTVRKALLSQGKPRAE